MNIYETCFGGSMTDGGLRVSCRVDVTFVRATHILLGKTIITSFN